MSKVYEALIEIPKGSANKYEFDKESGKIKLDRVLFSSVFYPADYGYFENTLALDGDPTDVLVLTTYPLVPGCLVDVRVVGMLDMIDSGDEDQKVIAVPVEDPRFNNVNNINDVNEHTKAEIEEFFRTYKNLQNKTTEIGKWHDAQAAIDFIEESKVRYQNEK